MRTKYALSLISGGIALILALAGCSTAATPQKDSGLIHVVTSTNVYGDIVKQIGGDRVTVTSIISDPAQDPHSYQADAQVQLALSKADLVIQNGGGYDDFVDTLLKGANNAHAALLSATTISGYDQKPATGEFNEHLWYDFPTVQKVVTKIELTLAKLDPKHASSFAAKGATFSNAVTSLESSEAALKTSAVGEGAAITESVPLYLLDAIGLVNKTPGKFSAAIEAGTDVSPLVLTQTLALFNNHAVKLLAYNEQTSGPQTAQVLAAAKKASVAVVPVRETLPVGKDYISWMTDILAAITAALK